MAATARRRRGHSSSSIDCAIRNTGFHALFGIFFEF
jgi:hypothetical protein